MCNFCCCCFDPSHTIDVHAELPLNIYSIYASIFQTRRLKYAAHYTTFRWAHFSTCCRSFFPSIYIQPSSFPSIRRLFYSLSHVPIEFFKLSNLSAGGQKRRERRERERVSRKWNERKLNIFLTILVGKMVMLFNFITSVFIIICFIFPYYM